MTEHAIELGDVVEVLKGYADNSFDAVLCDPPYGLSFMGKRWDYDVPQAALWREVLRVCKPGAALIAFSGTRTYHRTVVQIEDAGWEIRDQLAWMYGSGFPKSLDVSKAIDAKAGAKREVVGSRKSQGGRTTSPNPMDRDRGDGTGDMVSITAPSTPLAQQWAGYGTALKPAWEPAVLARKPMESTVAANVAKWGVGALAIDACRIGTDDRIAPFGSPKQSKGGIMNGTDVAREPFEQNAQGRWPANVIMDEEAGAALDAAVGVLTSGSWDGKRSEPKTRNVMGAFDLQAERPRKGDSGGPSRFFYCAKVSTREREHGCEGLAMKSAAVMTDSEDGQARLESPRTGAGRGGGARNHHPTLKPIALTRWLARLIMPPNPGAILVPFAGSGSEMMGCLKAGWPAVLGIERESEYVEIARRRLAHHTRAA